VPRRKTENPSKTGVIHKMQVGPGAVGTRSTGVVRLRGRQPDLARLRGFDPSQKIFRSVSH
jgi:hypothetical protein